MDFVLYQNISDLLNETEGQLTNLCQAILAYTQECNGLQTYTVRTFIIGKPYKTVDAIHKTVTNYLIKVFQDNCKCACLVLDITKFNKYPVLLSNRNIQGLNPLSPVITNELSRKKTQYYCKKNGSYPAQHFRMHFQQLIPIHHLQQL